jgi:hypothetical protein
MKPATIRIFQVETETSKLGEAAFTYRKAAKNAEDAIQRVKDEEFVPECKEVILSVKQIAMESA